MTGAAPGAANRAAGRTLVVRADASTAGGTGHFMRALALAQAWLDAGGRVRWPLVRAPEALADRVRAEGIELELLRGPDAAPPEPGDDADAQVVARLLADDPGAVAALDSMAFDTPYLRSLGEAAARTLVVDDGAALPEYPVGFVLNQNAHADRAEYPAAAGPRYLLGLDYVLLRREFRARRPPPRDVPARARRLLVTFGGADPTGMTAKAVQGLARLPARTRDGLAVRILVGAANPRAAEVAREAAALAPMDVVVERAVDDMPATIAWADLALSSGGTTIWELAHGGCPTLVVETVPIEERLVDGLRKVGLGDHLGSGAALDADALAAPIAARIDDAAWRGEMSRLGARLVDGRGTERVIAAMTEVDG